MDKIRTLLEKLGSKDLADQILESFETYASSIREKVEVEYKQRLTKAKHICVEEIENYKRDLARKAQIFFESRVERIERQIAKQVTIRESAAESKLKDVHMALEGIELKGDAEAALKVAKKKVDDLRESLSAESSARRLAEGVANKAHALAEKALKRNRDLEQMVVETKRNASKKVVKEGKTTNESNKVVKKSGRPKTANPINEETVRKSRSKKVTTHSMNGYSPDAVAELVGEL